MRISEICYKTDMSEEVVFEALEEYGLIDDWWNEPTEIGEFFCLLGDELKKLPKGDYRRDITFLEWDGDKILSLSKFREDTIS